MIITLSICLYPQAFQEILVTYLAGMYWNPENKDELFFRISQTAGMRGVPYLAEKL